MLFGLLNYSEIAEAMNVTGALPTSLFYGFTSSLAANVLNNIPMTVAFVPLIEEHGLTAALATVIGSNLGTEITPLGSLAGMMWLSMLRERK